MNAQVLARQHVTLLVAQHALKIVQDAVDVLMDVILNALVDAQESVPDVLTLVRTVVLMSVVDA